MVSKIALWLGVIFMVLTAVVSMLSTILELPQTVWHPQFAIAVLLFLMAVAWKIVYKD